MSTGRKWLILGVVAFVLSCTSVGIGIAADKTYGSVIVTKVVSVYDGDTFKVDIDSWPDIVGKSISIRIYGIDTPEIRGTKGEVKELAVKARRYTAFYLEAADVVEIVDMRRGKYFRIIAEVYVDGENLAELLIEEGLAKPYYGGKRPIW